MSTEDSSKDHYTGNRRKALKLFSLAALSAITVPAFGKDKDTSGNTGKLSYKVYGTLEEMKNDKSLKANEAVRILGYYAVNDGGASEYLVVKTSEYYLKEEQAISLPTDLSAVFIHPGYINYKMFGAVGDGHNNDCVQIRDAHNYANKKNIPVINHTGEFWFKEVKRVEILTNVQWGNTIFHIDEKFNSKSGNRFAVLPSKPPVEIKLSESDKKDVLSLLKKGVQNVPQLAPYKNSLVIIADANDKIGYRAGAKYKGQSWAREELFYVEEDGKILGDIAWEFKDYTKFIAYPAEENYLIIEGGTFYLSGDSPGVNYEGYKSNGFKISRSRTIIRNQWVGLEPNKKDVALDPRSGFYTFSTAYDITLENVRLIPYEQDREGKDRDVPAGTYGISAGRILNGLFKGITAEGGAVHWGVFGTNLNKNFRVERCQLNRVDVHFHCWNLYIKDSQIGYRGISVTGGGDLFIDNTRCSSRSFINFRRDFGSKWDGNIRISNCRFVPVSNSDSISVLSFNPMDFDHKYPVGFGRSIIIENLLIDFNAMLKKDTVCWIMSLPTFSKTKNGKRLFFPEYLEFRNIRVTGRDKGVRLLKISNPHTYILEKSGSYDGIRLKSNSCMIFQNIHLEDLEKEKLTEAHLYITNPKDEEYEDEYALYPSVKFYNCEGVVFDNSHNVSDISFDYCSISGFSENENNPLKGRLFFNNCTFHPVIKDQSKKIYYLSSELGTSLTNCVINAPVFNEEPRPDLFDNIDFIKINKSIKFNHLNTILGRDVINYYKTKGIKFLPNFIGMLKAHHEMEPESI